VHPREGLEGERRALLDREAAGENHQPRRGITREGAEELGAELLAAVRRGEARVVDAARHTRDPATRRFIDTW
jgi:hypothetical protein